MPRYQPPRFLKDDEVENAQGHRGRIVLSYPRKKDGKTFPMVLVKTGPQTGQRIWPDLSWRALLDYDPPTIACRCSEDDCGRSFRAPTSCRTCRQCSERLEREDKAVGALMRRDGVASRGIRRAYVPGGAPMPKEKPTVSEGPVKRLPGVVYDDDTPFG